MVLTLFLKMMFHAPTTRTGTRASEVGIIEDLNRANLRAIMILKIES